MKALILAAGPCTRLRPLTDDRHKCLVELRPGLTVLDLELRQLEKNGIRQIVITTGYFEDAIRDHVSRHFAHLDVTFVTNPDFAVTNCIESMWLARASTDDDLVFLTGDLVFDDIVLHKLLAAPAESVMYVHPDRPLPKKDFKARIGQDGRITEIGVDVFGPDARFCWPLYRLSRRSWNVWMEEIGRAVATGERSIYGEVAFNRVAADVNLSPAFIDDFCTEVDDHDDLARAREHFARMDTP